MDLDELREAADEWVAEDIVTREQADAIVARHGTDGDDTSRLVVALSLMGAALVGAGLLWYLLDAWEALHRAVRTALLALAPLGFAAVGDRLSRGRAPRAGHALWFLGAAFAGPSIVLLADLWSLDVGTEWLLLAWAALALPAGHVRRSRPTTALGLLAAAGTVLVLEDASRVPLAAGMFGVVVFALGVRYRLRAAAQLSDAYRLTGAALVILTLLAYADSKSSYHRPVVHWHAVEATVATAVTVVAALVAVAAVVTAWRGATWGGGPGGTVERAEAVWTAAATAGLAVAAGAISAVPTLPGVAALLVVHGCLLVLLVATVGVGTATGSRTFVNGATAAFFAQVATFLATTVIDAVAGAAALVITGVALLAVAVALERGRRELLGRMVSDGA